MTDLDIVLEPWHKLVLPLVIRRRRNQDLKCLGDP